MIDWLILMNDWLSDECSGMIDWLTNVQGTDDFYNDWFNRKDEGDDDKDDEDKNGGDSAGKLGYGVTRGELGNN